MSKRLNLKKIPSLTHVEKKPECVVIISIRPYIKIGKFIILVSGVQTIRRGQYGHKVKIYVNLENILFYFLIYSR